MSLVKASTDGKLRSPTHNSTYKFRFQILPTPSVTGTEILNTLVSVPDYYDTGGHGNDNSRHSGFRRRPGRKFLKVNFETLPQPWHLFCSRKRVRREIIFLSSRSVDCIPEAPIWTFVAILSPRRLSHPDIASVSLPCVRQLRYLTPRSRWLCRHCNKLLSTDSATFCCSPFSHRSWAALELESKHSSSTIMKITNKQPLMPFVHAVICFVNSIDWYVFVYVCVCRWWTKNVTRCPIW